MSKILYYKDLSQTYISIHIWFLKPYTILLMLLVITQAEADIYTGYIFISTFLYNYEYNILCHILFIITPIYIYIYI